MHAPGPWDAIAIAVLALPAHQPLEVPRDRLPHPRGSGFYESTGLNRKCLHHYRLALPDGRGLHVHVHRRRYVVHWDRVDPSVSVLRHFFADVTRALARSVRRIRLEAVRLGDQLAETPPPAEAPGLAANAVPQPA